MTQQTPRGITYPEATDHTRLWEHIQAAADTTDDALDVALGGTGWRIQSGSFTVNMGGAADASQVVTWPEPFSGTPVVVASARPFAARRYVATVNPPSAVDTTIFVSEHQGATGTNDVTVQWIAIGPR